MVTGLLGLLAFLVFGVLWLVHQDVFEFLPKGVRRAIETSGGLVLVGACLLFPASFQAGFMRFVENRSGQVVEQLWDAVDAYWHAAGDDFPERGAHAEGVAAWASAALALSSVSTSVDAAASVRCRGRSGLAAAPRAAISAVHAVPAQPTNPIAAVISQRRGS
jgi:hypothetical protein